MPQAALSVVYNIPGRPRKPQHEPQPIIEELPQQEVVEPQVQQPVIVEPEAHAARGRDGRQEGRECGQNPSSARPCHLPPSQHGEPVY